MGLGYLGLGENEKARGYFEETLQLDPHHLMAKLYQEDIKN
jgi:Tfp pilus assembly protein PilF